MRVIAASGLTTRLRASLRSPAAAPTKFSGLWSRSSGERGQITAHTSLNLTSALTIEFWAFPFDDIVAFPVLVNKGAVNTAYTVLINASDQMQVTIKPAGAQVDCADTVAVTRNAWTHWAATLDGTDLRLYKNGTQVNVVACAAASTNAGDLWVGGSDSATANAYAGLIDELRIWNVVRSQAEIDANKAVDIAPATAGLVAYYKFSEGRARTAANSVPSGGPGSMSLQNSDQWSIATPF